MASKIITIDSVKQCTKCKLCKTRYHVVIGRGNLTGCDVFCIGEAPGKAEDLLGEAFVGEAGKLLDKMFKKSGLGRVRLFITNTVMCHPTNKRGGDNRQPEQDEILSCMGNISTLINWANPRKILLIGDVALTYYKKSFPGYFHIMHPALLLRNGGEYSPHYLKNIRILEELYASL